MLKVIYNIRRQYFKRRLRFLPGAKNLCQPQDFNQRLFIEKRRAERLHTKSSILVFDLSHLAEDHKYGPLKQLDVEYLVKSISSILRITDSVSLRTEAVILILLPDTDFAGAQCVCDKINKHLASVCQHYFKVKELDFKNFDIEIISFPEKINEEKIAQYLPSELTQNLETNPERRRIQAMAVDHDQYKNLYVPNLNLHIGVFNGSALSFPALDIFFIDADFYQNLSYKIQRIIKRIIDILGAVVGLVLFSPIMLLAAILIKLSSPGPIIYKQKRLGYHGQEFTFLKFRSMESNCECQLHQEYVLKYIRGENEQINNGTQEKPLYKIIDDPRATRIGRWIRKASIDEMPQFWNVLKGEMSLVGPRPAIPYELTAYQCWHCRRVLDVKPGITGLWQVSGRNRTTFNEMVRLDLYYAKNWSLYLDLKIILKTFKVLFISEAA